MSKKDKEYTIDYFEYQANETKKKYMEELDRVLAIYKRALELAVREIVYDCGSWKLTIEDEMQDYLDQAKKELEEQDVKN